MNVNYFLTNHQWTVWIWNEKKNTIQLTLAIKIKHSGMNLAKYVQVIYEENHKNMKKSKNK